MMEQIFVPQPGSPLKRVLVEGAPGIWKSTFAWELCHKWGEIDCMQQFSLVVLLHLREKMAQEATCLTDLLFHEPSIDIEAVNKVMEKSRGRRVLFVLDGFEMLPKYQREHDSIYCKMIRGEFLAEATILVTSRSSVSAQLLWSCENCISRHLEIVGFAKNKVRSYAESILEDDSLENFLSYV